MNSDYFLSTLGLAKRAGKLYFGFEAVAENATAADLVFIASDCSERTKRNINYIFSDTGAQCILVKYDKAELSAALGTKPVGVIAVTDAGFAKLLKLRLSKEETE